MAFVQPLVPNRFRSNRTMTKFPQGNAPEFSSAVDWDALYTNWIASVRSNLATTYYVDPIAGSNTNDGLTRGNAFSDPTAAYAVMNSGDEVVIIGDGIVITDNNLFAFNDHEHNIPAGASRLNKTIIRAETPFGVRIKYTANTRHFFYEAIRLNTTSFVLIDGFIIEWLNDDGEPQYVGQVNAAENVITRTIIKRDVHNAYGGFINMPANYCLLQDFHCVGGARYGIQTGGGTTEAGGKNIVRRSVVRVDYTASNQPLAPFSHYGNNSGFGSGETEFQNCIPIDGPYFDVSPSNNDNFDYTWGGFYHPKNARDIRHRGCLVVNQGGRAGFWATDNSSAYGYVFEDCAVFGENPVKYGSRAGIHANPNGTADRLTFVDVDGPDLHFGISAANTYASDTPPTSIFNAPGGADLRYCYGAFGSVWDEAGFDQITTDALWTFPYEDKIREVFREDLPTPDGYDPDTNDSTRGFCANGETLTRYIAAYSAQSVDEVLGGLY